MTTLLDQIRAEPYALKAMAEDRSLDHLLEPLDTSWASFVPRPDHPELFDQQAAFVNSRDTVSFLIGGNAAGTTAAACYKLAQFVLYDQPPPRPNTPFWIISNTYDQVCGVIWDEKLSGRGYIPTGEVDWEKIRWYRTNQNWPLIVPLKPWPDDRPGAKPGCNWQLEFKSYEQGRRAFQARSIGGFMFSEQFPVNLFVEVFRGCRVYMFPGGQFCEFTPVEPELCLWVEKAMDDRPEGWNFYRCNIECNDTLADGFVKNFLASVPDEMVETRKTGALATFEGVIYQSFNPSIHVVGDDVIHPTMQGAWHHRGIDWGASEEHPFACVWGYHDAIGDWFVYDEYWSTDQSAITADHANEIIERSKEWGWPPRDQEWHPYYGLSYADPSRPGELNEFNRRGIVCHPASNAVYEGIDAIRALLKIHVPTGRPHLFIHHRCKHLIEEMRKYRWKKGRRPESGMLLNPQVAAPVPLKRDDDTVDALRYMIYSAARARGAKPTSARTKPKDENSRAVQLQRTGMVSPSRGKSNGHWFQRK